MLFSKSAARMRFQIGLKSSRLFFTVESNSGLNFPRLQWGGMRNCTAVMSGKAFLQVGRISYVVMCLCGYIGENINIEKGHNKGSRIRMMVRCSTIWRSPTSFRRFRHTPLLRLRTTPWHFFNKRCPASFQRLRRTPLSRLGTTPWHFKHEGPSNCLGLRV